MHQLNRDYQDSQYQDVVEIPEQGLMEVERRHTTSALVPCSQAES
jgi:hypothetical protein